MERLVSRKIDERIGEVRADLEELKEGQKNLSRRMDHMQEGIDNLSQCVNDFTARQEVLARNSEKRIERKIDEKFTALENRLVGTLDERFTQLTAQLRADLGINTDSRRRS